MIRQYVDTDKNQVMEIFNACLLSHDFISDNDRAFQCYQPRSDENYDVMEKGKYLQGWVLK